ncbi:outer membrane protein assembly factor BamA [Patescibacteria group bacterium]|nr:outer membrane protein assembly factor BamA [Patescibacteria group bacterium]
MIKEVRIQENHWIEEDEIKKVIKSKVGESLSEEKVREDMQLIYDLGYFSSLKALKEDTPEGIILIFVVKENQNIAEIEFRGVKGKEINELKKMLTFENKELWNFNKIKKSKEKITEFYHKRGYLSAKIDIFPLVIEKNQCKAVIDVDKGKLIRVMEVEIKGNHFFSVPKICSLMKTRFQRYFDRELLKEDIKKITRAYQQAGYYFAYFKQPEFSFFREDEVDWVKIFLEVVEGKKFSVGEIDVEGNSVLSTHQILDLISPRKSEVFDSTQLKKSIDRIQDMYAKRGCLYAQLNSSLDFNQENGLVRIEIVVKENEQVRIGNVRIEGNKTTKRRVFDHAMLLKKGDIFNVEELRESWRRLYNLGFFEKVEMEPHTTSSSSILDLLVKVEETEKRGTFAVGVSYGSHSGLEGFIQISKDNLWGEGKKIGVDWIFGEKRSDYEINYLDRWYRGSSTRLDIKLYDREREYEDYGEHEYMGEYEYIKRKTGVEIGLGWPWTKYLRFSLTAKVERVNITGDDLPEGEKEGEKTYQGLVPTLMRDSRVRDEAFNPYKGSYSLISIEKSGGFLGGDVDFTKYGVETRIYLRRGEFWKSPILALRLRGKWGDNLPYYEEFYVGGQNSLRGYQENEFVGTRVLLGTLELRIPVQEGIVGYLFVDVGKIWQRNSMEEFKVGYGFGVQINSPIGILRFDYGIAKEEKKFYFGMGEIF